MTPLNAFSVIPTGTNIASSSKRNYFTNKSALNQAFMDDNDDEEDEDDDDDYIYFEEDDDEDLAFATGPLKDGINSVSWLPPISPKSKSSSSSMDISTIRKGTEILPLFPLGGIVYTPNTEHILNIFEPRYRQMYNDILMNGSKRFIVSMSHPNPNDGSFASVGVIFQLEDLKEVSEQTGDQIKYICNHKVTNRVKIHKILNPDAWNTRHTYLKVEATVLEEEEEDDNSSTVNESQIKDSFAALVNKQHELEEDVRFTKGSVRSLAVAPGANENGLWMTIRLWQNFIEQRLISTQNEMQRDFQEKLIEFLKKEKGFSDTDLPSAIGMDDLSPSLQQEVQDLQKRMTTELRPLLLESTLTMQKILEANNHKERLDLLRHFIEAETSRLNAKSSLKGMFSGESSAVTKESNESKDDVKPSKVSDSSVSRSTLKGISTETGSMSSNSIFMDEPDAFQ